MRWKTVVCVVWLAPFVGCTQAYSTRPSGASAASVPYLDPQPDRHAQTEARVAWREVVRRYPAQSYSPEFTDGFTDGYATAVESGGSVGVPTAPPARYRRSTYQTPDGQALVKDYLGGFRYGSEVAQATGGRQPGLAAAPAQVSYPLPVRPTVPRYEPEPSGSFLARLVPGLAPVRPATQVPAYPTAPAYAAAPASGYPVAPAAATAFAPAPGQVYPAAYRHTVDNGFTASYMTPQPTPTISLPDPLPLYPRPQAAVVQASSPAFPTDGSPALPPPDLDAPELTLPAPMPADPPAKAVGLPTITVDPVPPPPQNNYLPEVLPPVNVRPAPVAPVKSQPAPRPPAERAE